MWFHFQITSQQWTSGWEKYCPWSNLTCTKTVVPSSLCRWLCNPSSCGVTTIKITWFSCSSWLVGGERIWQLLRMWLQLPASPDQAVPLSPWWQGGAVHHWWSRDWLPQVWLDTGTLRYCWLWARWVLPSNMLCLSVEIYVWFSWVIVFCFFTSGIQINVWFSFFDSCRVECDGCLWSPETRWTSGAVGRCQDCHIWPLFK